MSPDKTDGVICEILYSLPTEAKMESNYLNGLIAQVFPLREATANVLLLYFRGFTSSQSGIH